MSKLPKPSEHNDFLVEPVAIMRRSFRHWTGRELVDPRMSDSEAARFLFHARFALVSHDAAKDPVFNYANQTALDLFGMSWETLTSLPSRLSAEASKQEDRELLLEAVRTQGYIEHYQGVRISRQGRRFSIENAVIWNLINGLGACVGQAALFKEWKFL